jgi:hypothetical protein
LIPLDSDRISIQDSIGIKLSERALCQICGLCPGDVEWRKHGKGLNAGRVVAHRGKTGHQPGLRSGASIRNDDPDEAFTEFVFLLGNLRRTRDVTQTTDRRRSTGADDVGGMAITPERGGAVVGESQGIRVGWEEMDVRAEQFIEQDIAIKDLGIVFGCE